MSRQEALSHWADSAEHCIMNCKFRLSPYLTRLLHLRTYDHLSHGPGGSPHLTLPCHYLRAPGTRYRLTSCCKLQSRALTIKYFYNRISVVVWFYKNKNKTLFYQFGQVQVGNRHIGNSNAAMTTAGEVRRVFGTLRRFRAQISMQFVVYRDDYRLGLGDLAWFKFKLSHFPSQSSRTLTSFAAPYYDIQHRKKKKPEIHSIFVSFLLILTQRSLNSEF